MVRAGVGLALLTLYISLMIYFAFRAVKDPKACTSILLKIYVNYCQMTAVSFAVAKIGMRDYYPFAVYLDITDFLSQDPVGVVMKLDCLLGLGGNGKVMEYFFILMAHGLVPASTIIMLVMFLLFSCVRAICRSCCSSKGRKKRRKTDENGEEVDDEE